MDLQFLDDKQKILTLQKDVDELHLAMKNNMHKASMVLIGSILESCLYYFISNNLSIKSNIENFEKRKLGLNDLLQFARKQGLLSEELFRLSEPIRDLRNTIHPKVQERFKDDITTEMVQIGYNVLTQIMAKLRSQSKRFKSEHHAFILNQIFDETLGETPDYIDNHIYGQILIRYGDRLGALIIKRSLQSHE